MSNTSDSLFQKKKIRYYYELIPSAVIALITGFLLWKNVLARFYLSPIPNYVLILILFFVMTFIYSILCGITEVFLQRIRPKKVLLTFKKVLLYSLISSVIVGWLSGVLEFIYELQPHSKVDAPDEIIYLIDDSDSMGQNDPMDLRLDSVVQINDKLKNGTKVGLIRFASKVNMNISPVELTDENKDMINSHLSKGTGGGTQIETALQAAIDQYKNFDKSGLSSNEDEKVRTILMITDGKSNSVVDEDYIVSECKDLGIRIDVISLGNDTDLGFLYRIANSTGGELAKAPSDYYINAAYLALIGEDVRRCLLTPVIIIDSFRILLAFVQILFLWVISLALNYVVTFLFRFRPYINRHFTVIPKVLAASSILLAICDASFIAIFVLMACMALPLYDGRAIVRKLNIRLPHFPKHILSLRRIGKEGSVVAENIVDSGLKADNNLNVNDRLYI